MDAEAGDKLHVLGGIVAHKHTAHRPVDHIYAADITGTDTHVITLSFAGCIEAWQVCRSVTEVSVHLEDVVVPLLYSPLETGYIGCTEAQLAAALDEKETLAELIFHKALDYGGGAVGRAVVDNEDVESRCSLGPSLLLLSSYGTNDVLYVLLLVVSGDNYDAVSAHDVCVGSLYFGAKVRK